MIDLGRRPGWDRRAITTIARRDYGSLEGMFEAHGWDPGELSRSQAVPALIVAAYGSVERFVDAHEGELPSPLDVINANEPDVWLTSFYGFTPRNWGFLGFTQERTRQSFIRRSRPGALIVVYSAPGGAAEDRDRILGIQQVRHVIGDAQEFMTPEEWQKKQSDPGRAVRWNYGVQAVRAWRVTAETRPLVQDFADITFTPGRARVIGSQGLKLTGTEARKLLDLDLEEVEVFNGPSILQAVAGPASNALRPSRPGPVSSAPFMVREAEGPKHLYILAMNGNADHLMGRDVEGAKIVKVGFSRSPETRRNDHNRTLPACAFEWSVAYSTFIEGRDPFPSSAHALAGEKAMKDWLERYGESLGGEFFLADEDQIDRAWTRGIAAAEKWSA